MAQSVSFQFHDGTIKTGSTLSEQKMPSNFNSMMVQLKRTLNAQVTNAWEFQFHDGTIKTHIYI